MLDGEETAVPARIGIMGGSGIRTLGMARVSVKSHKCGSDVW